MPTETQQTIYEWGLKTFGKRSPQSLGIRANTEMAELLDALERLREAKNQSWDVRKKLRKDVLKECADVTILLNRLTSTLSGDLAEEVDSKMEINRKRRWEPNGEGRLVRVSDGTNPAGDPEEDLSPEQLAAVVFTYEGSPIEVAAASPEVYRALQDVLYHEGRKTLIKELSRRRSLPPSVFVEEGTGLTMRIDHYYVISDSGGSYQADGFATPEEAEAWVRGDEFRESYGLQEPNRCAYNEAKRDWENGGLCETVNIVRGYDLWLFWQHNPNV